MKHYNYNFKSHTGCFVMCFNVSIHRLPDYLETRFDAKFVDPEAFNRFYHVSAFKVPTYPVIANEHTEQIQFFSWGLIPFWVKDEASANKIRFNTFNAKSETIFEKPSFRGAIAKKRCLVLVDGFFEWHEAKGKKFPYFIKLKSNDSFALAGIWDAWENKNTGEVRKTFSIITTEANPLMAKIHNTKKRMPVILRTKDEERWLKTELETDEIKSLMVPYDQSDMEVYSVSKLISQRGANTNVPEILDKVEYDEIRSEQTTLF